MGKLTRILLTVAALLATPSLADRSVDEAKARFKRGTELYDEGNFRGALIEFERAHLLLPNYKMLYNIGQVHLQLVDYGRAQEALQRYLKEGGADVAAARRDEVIRELERLKTRVGRIAVNTADGAEVLIDDESFGFAPLPAPVPANTGRHKVTVVPSGKGALSRMVEVAGMELTTVTLGKDAPLAQASPAPVVAAPPVAITTSPQVGPATRSKAPMVIGWVVTGTLAATAGLMAGLAFGGQAELKRFKATLGVTQASLDLAAGKVSTFGTAGDVLGIAAIIAGGVSLFLTVNALSSEQVALSVGPSGVTVFARF